MTNDEGFSHATFSVVTCSILAALAVNQYAPSALNADTILQSVISLQNVTVFYWGQNRFANFIPLLLYPVRNPEWNMLGLLWIYAISLFGFLAVISVEGSRLLYPEFSWPGRWLFFTILIAVIFVGFNPSASAMLVAEGQPYPPSFFLLSIAAFLVIPKQRSWAALVFGLLSLFVAIGTNPAILLLVASLSVLIFAGAGRRNMLVLILSALAIFGVWTALSRRVPSIPISYFALELGEPLVALSTTARHIYDALNPVFFAFVGAAIVARAIIYCIGLRIVVIDRIVAFLGLLAVGWWLAFSMSSWVKANNYGLRYFTVTLLAMAGMVTLPLLALAAQSGRLAKRYWATLCLVAFLSQVCRAPVPFDKYTVIDRTAPNVAFADSQGIKYIAGDYWDAWPTVFQLLNRGKPSFGLAGRGEGNLHHVIASINEDLKQDIIPKALCVSEAYETCAWWASHITGYTWVPPKLPCPDLSCRIITMKVKDRESQ